jgi:3-isopropylmalate/(R)-2-methylmalate dehydratase small subunit
MVIPFKKLKSIVAPLDRANVDTDQIVPKQFLKRIERSGFGEFLFYDWRYREDGDEDPEFILNQSRYRGAKILVARANFGCGSSREHAAWALLDHGFRALIAPSFADIFKNNCRQNGILTIELDDATVDSLFDRIQQHEGYEMAVDLDEQKLTGSDGFVCLFEIDPFPKRCLLEGLDDIDISLEYEPQIAAYEASHREYWQAALIGAAHGGTTDEP